MNNAARLHRIRFHIYVTLLVALEQIGQRHEGRYMHNATGGSPDREF